VKLVLTLGLIGWLAGCAAQSDGDGSGDGRPDSASNPVTAPHNANQGAAGTGVTAGIAGSPGTAGGPAPNGMAQGNGAPSGDCSANGPFKKEGCPCRAGETAACWTGPLADRNVGKCHDGLQICTANEEFASWGPCMGEELSCGSDAGVPPADSGAPPPPEDCPCIPGAVIQCSEDCTVGIICSLTATKTCLPDRTWSVCREDTGATLDLPGVQCRNMLHGCLDVLAPDGMQGQGELYVGDCSKQFECGHAPQVGATAAGDAE
jgi:hypothetical protein